MVGVGNEASQDGSRPGEEEWRTGAVEWWSSMKFGDQPSTISLSHVMLRLAVATTEAPCCIKYLFVPVPTVSASSYRKQNTAGIKDCELYRTSITSILAVAHGHGSFFRRRVDAGSGGQGDGAIRVILRCLTFARLDSIISSSCREAKVGRSQ